MQIKIFTKFNTIYDKEKNSPKSRHRSKMMWCAESLQSCPTLCNTMNYSLSGFSVHGILQARILEWVAISFSNILRLNESIFTLSKTLRQSRCLINIS